MTNKMSREHLFRQSLKDHIWHSPSTSVTRYSSGQTERRTEIPTSIFDRAVGGICVVCNNGWMNQTDQLIEPLLIELANGRRNDIPPSEILPFARWAVKLALLRAETDRGSGWQADPLLFNEFYRRRMPPAKTVIRVGRTRTSLKEGGSNGTLAYVLMGDDTLVAETRTNVVSWSLKMLFVHVTLCSQNREARQQLAQVNSPVGQIAGDELPKVWPNDRRGVRIGTWIERETAARVSNMNHLVSGAPLRSSDYG